ncbi:MAG: hypothetical protein WA979_13750, partial [Pacificimonas sp.]
MSLSDVGSYCSIFGLLISLATLAYAFGIERKITKLKRQFLFNTRVSSILSSLKGENTKLQSLLDKDYVS